MVVLAFYGLHRYQLVWLYFQAIKRTPPRWYEPGVQRFPKGELPFVTIQLPIFNEQFVIHRLLDACCRLDYPRDRFEIQVLDDSTDETVTDVARGYRREQLCWRLSTGWRRSLIVSTCIGPIAMAIQGRCARCRAEAPRAASSSPSSTPTSCRLRDWMMKVIHHFAEPGIGMVQTRWTHLNRNYSFLTQVEAILLDGHFVLEHGGRSRAGVFFNFNGTAGMWRAKLIGGRRRVAARHPDRGHRPELPRAAGGMRSSSICRMSSARPSCPSR